MQILHGLVHMWCVSLVKNTTLRRNLTFNGSRKAVNVCNIVQKLNMLKARHIKKRFINVILVSDINVRDQTTKMGQNLPKNQ